MAAYLPSYLEETFQAKPRRVRQSLPFPEPERPSEGWVFPVAKPYISQKAEASVVTAIRRGSISSSTQPIQDFQDELKRFFQSPTVKACSNGYSGLLLCLRLAGIGPGDDVLVPSLTMVAVANAVCDVGGKPIYVDVSMDSYNPSPKQFLSSVTENSKAIIVTHTYGLPADLDGIREVCDKHQLALIEDISESIGSTYKGTITGVKGDFAAASLYANKLITSGDGGFVLSRHTEWKGVPLQARLESLVNHGFMPKYHFMHLEQSGNYKMAGLAAALVTPSVKDIPILIQNRIQLANWYRLYLSDVPGIKLMPTVAYSPDAPWVFCVELQSKAKRHEIRCALALKGVETRDFFLPLHLQPALCSVEDTLDPAKFANSEHLGEVGLYLPTYFELKQSQVLWISNALRCAVGSENYQN